MDRAAGVFQGRGVVDDGSGIAGKVWIAVTEPTNVAVGTRIRWIPLEVWL